MTSPVSTPARSARNSKPNVRLVVERGQDLGDVAGADAHLGLVVALADGPVRLLAEAGLQAGLERASIA